MVRLYEGCWGVTRNRWVVKVSATKPPHECPFRMNNEILTLGIYCFGNGVSNLSFYGGTDKYDILHVFPTESAARAHLSRPLWWRRVKGWLSAHWYPSWAKRWWTRRILDVVLIHFLVAIAIALSGCRSVTSPCRQERPEVIGGGLMGDSAGGVVDSTNNCEDSK